MFKILVAGSFCLFLTACASFQNDAQAVMKPKDPTPGYCPIEVHPSDDARQWLQNQLTAGTLPMSMQEYIHRLRVQQDDIHHYCP